MKRLGLLLATLVALPILLAFGTPADAHGRWRGGVSLHFGFPLWYWGWPAYYEPRPYYYDYPVVIDRGPITYIERDEVEAPSQVWWYWCPGQQRYYPYTRECPTGWQRVPPQPAR